MANLIKTDGKAKVEVQLLVYIFREGKYFTSFCPALNLSSFGDSEKEAKKGFDEAVKIFFEDTAERGTLEKVLLDLGWTLQKLPTAKYTPPSAQLLTQSYPGPTRKFKERVSIPVH